MDGISEECKEVPCETASHAEVAWIQEIEVQEIGQTPASHPRMRPGDVLVICVAETCECTRENGGATSTRM